MTNHSVGLVGWGVYIHVLSIRKKYPWPYFEETPINNAVIIEEKSNIIGVLPLNTSVYNVPALITKPTGTSSNDMPSDKPLKLRPIVMQQPVDSTIQWPENYNQSSQNQDVSKKKANFKMLFLIGEQE